MVGRDYLTVTNQPFLRVVGNNTNINYNATSPFVFGGTVIQQGGIFIIPTLINSFNDGPLSMLSMHGNLVKKHFKIKNM